MGASSCVFAQKISRDRAKNITFEGDIMMMFLAMSASGFSFKYLVQ
jgi:hypothetical protein